MLVCGSYFCAARLLEQARGKCLPPPATLSLGASGFLSCRFGCRGNKHGRRVRLLAFGLPLTKTLLLAHLSLEMLLAPTQTLLLLPGR